MTIFSSFILYIMVFSVVLLCSHRVDRLTNNSTVSTVLPLRKKHHWHLRFSRKRVSICFYLFCMVVVPSALAGLRADTVGTDILIYGKQMMKEAEGVTSFAQLLRIDITNTEIGYQFYAFIVSRFFSGTGWWLFFTQLFIMVFFVAGLYKFRNDMKIWHGMAVFLFCFYHVSLNVMRQFMGMSVMILAFYYLIRKKNIRYWLLVALATTFHTFSLIVAVMIFALWVLRNWYNNRSRRIVVTILMVLFIVGFTMIITKATGFYVGVLARYVKHLGTGSEVGLIDMLTSPSFLIMLFLLLSTYYITFSHKAKEEENVVYMISLVGVICKFLQVYLDIVYRVGQFLLFYYTLFIPFSFRYPFRISRKQRAGILLIILFLYWLSDCMLTGHSSTAIFDLRI